MFVDLKLTGEGAVRESVDMLISDVITHIDPIDDFHGNCKYFDCLKVFPFLSLS